MGFLIGVVVPIVIGFSVGVGLIPAAIYLLGPSYPAPNITGRVMATLAQLSYGQSVILQRENNSYEWLAGEWRWAVTDDDDYVVDVSADDKDAADYDDSEYRFVVQPKGEKRPLAIKGSESEMERLGKAPVSFAAEKTDAQMERFEAEWQEPTPRDDEVIDVESSTTVSVAATDGGTLLDGRTHNGKRIFNVVPDHRGYVVKLLRHRHKILDSAGAETIGNAVKEAVREHGGANRIGTLMMVILSLFSLIAGSAMAIIAFMVM